VAEAGRWRFGDQGSGPVPWRRRGLLAAALVAAGGAVLARTPAPVAARRAALPLTVLYGGSDLGALPIWLAGRLGYFGAEGLAVRAVRLPWDAVPTPMTRLTLGQAEFVTISMDMLEADLDCCAASSTRADGVYVAAALPVPVFSLLAGRGTRGVADLRGRTVGVAGEAASAAHYDLDVVLRHAGVAPSAVHLRNGLPSQEVFRLMRAGRLAAAMLPPPQSIRALGLGFVALAEAAVYRQPYPSAWLACDRRWAAAHPAVTVRFLRAFMAGLRAVRAEPTAAVAAVAAALGLAQRDLAKASYRACLPFFAARPFPPLQGVRAALEMIAVHHPQVGAAARAADPARFVDDHWLAQAL
jgi:ABC-type nitrate/sulfonate/bicarbonate transport system substrate-binding protein